jgi:HSP20 family protein
VREVRRLKMNLTKWDPLKIYKDFPLFALPPFLGKDFAVDLYEEKGNLVAEMNLPGMKQENIDVTFQNGNLKVTARREEKKETKERDFFCKEIERGAYERVIALPAEVNTEKTEAHYTDGMLKIVIPMKQSPRKETVKVKIT